MTTETNALAARYKVKPFSGFREFPDERVRYNKKKERVLVYNRYIFDNIDEPVSLPLKHLLVERYQHENSDMVSGQLNGDKAI